MKHIAHISDTADIPLTYITSKLRGIKHKTHIRDITDIYPVKIAFITKLFNKIIY